MVMRFWVSRASHRHRQQLPDFIRSRCQRAGDFSTGVYDDSSRGNVRSILLRDLAFSLQQHLAQTVPGYVNKIFFNRTKAYQGNGELLAVGLLPFFDFLKQDNTRSTSRIRENEKERFSVAEQILE